MGHIFTVCSISHHSSSQGDRFVGAMSVIKARAPVTGGNFGVWGGMFSTFDCAVKGWRQKEDMWNAIISGFMTGGCLAARSESSICALPKFAFPRDACLEACLELFAYVISLGGPRSALGSAIACGILLSVFEGVGVLISRVFNDNTRPQLPPCECSLISCLHIFLIIVTVPENMQAQPA